MPQTGTTLTPSHRSMADLLAFLETAPDLDPTRRRDLRSAIRRLCDLAGREPAHLPAEVAALRTVLARLHPVQAGIGPKTLANLKANALAALRLFRRTAPASRPRLTADWQALRDRLSEDRLAHGLSRFIGACSARGIAPDAVDDAVLERFAQWLRQETFVAKPNGVLRRTAQLWNRAADTVAGWPGRRLTVPSFRPPRRTLPLSALPFRFQADVTAHLLWLQGQDLFAPHPPPRVCRPSTAALRRAQIEGAASALIAGGVDREAVRSLADLVTPDALRSILRQYLARTGNNPTQYLRDLAEALIQIARHWVRADDAQIEALKALRRRLKAERIDLTPKNRAALRQFDDPANQANLLLLPQRLMAKAARRPAEDMRAAITVQVAVALEILLIAPMRMGNLIALRLDRHVVPCGKEIHLVLPRQETKTDEELVYPLGGPTVAMLELYCRRYRPRIAGPDCPWLFPATGGRQKAQATLNQQIGETVYKATGLVLTPHQFRHLAAKLVLDRHPGNYEGARQLLAHRSLKTTVGFYTGLQPARAARHYDALLAEKRAAYADEAPKRGRKGTGHVWNA